MKYDEKDLRECPHNDTTCPYWDWQTQKCTMYAEEGAEPSEECDGQLPKIFEKI